VADKRKYADRRAYLIRAVARRRAEIRQRAIDYLGGCCQRCGYDRGMEALEFHHRDSARKEFGISSSGYTRGWAKVRAELRKCDLLCANCHRETHVNSSFRGKPRLKNWVNSGKPKPRQGAG
jgi:5-methylcytosine-specific restriction endonuclease McrA